MLGTSREPDWLSPNALLMQAARTTPPITNRRMAIIETLGDSRMRSICALRDRFALIVVASSVTFLAPAASAQGVPTAAGEAPRFEPAPCPKLPGAEELAKASCGYLVIPENRSRPTGRTIRLLIAKYPARSPEKRPDPVVYLAGATSPPWTSTG